MDLVINNDRTYADGKDLYAVEDGRLVTYVTCSHPVYCGPFLRPKSAYGSHSRGAVSYRQSVAVKDDVHLSISHLRPTVAGAWRAAAAASKLRLRKLRKARAVTVAGWDTQIAAELTKQITADRFCRLAIDERANKTTKPKHSTKAD